MAGSQEEALRPDGTTRCTPATLAKYTHAAEHMIVPFLGGLSLDELSRRQIEQWRDTLGEHYASTTVNTALTVLRAILRDVDRPVADSVRPLEVDDTRITEDEPNALDEEELARFIEAAGKEYSQHLALILVMLTTGQRTSTVLALEWGDIDPEKGTIMFRRRLSLGEVVSGVKRKRTARDVAPLVPEVWAELQAHRTKLNEAQVASGLVFPAEDGRHHDRTILRDPFKRILEVAGIKKRFTPHGCRRTASALYRRAAGSAVSKSIVGHTTDRMHEHYAVVATAEKGEAARKAFRVLKGGSGSEDRSPPAGGGDPEGAVG